MEKEKLHRFFAGTTSIQEGMDIRAWMEASEENKRIFYKERKLFDALMVHDDQTTNNCISTKRIPKIIRQWLKYNPQNEMFRPLGTKRSFSQNETFFFSHPYPALFRLISHF